MKIRKILFITFFVLCFLIIFSSKTNAVTVSKTGITSVGAETIDIDDDIEWNDPDSITINSGNLKYKTTSSGTILIYWNRTSFASETEYTASYTVVYEDVGVDEAGNSVDLSIYSYVTTTNKYTSTISWDSDDFLFCVASLTEDTFYARSQRETLNSSASFPHPAYVQSKQNFTVHIYKSGTTTDADGNFLFYGANIDAYRSTGAYSEALELTSGVNSNVYVESDTVLSISGNKFTATSTDVDDDEECALTCLMTSPFKFSWYGTNCRSELFIPFSTTSITSKIYTSTNGGSSYSLSYKGGSISATNTTTSGSNYSVLSQTSSTSKTIDTYWKNSYKYTTSSNTGYHLAKITYDGTTSTSSSNRTFSSVTSDHTFYAYYVANSYSVSFNGNGSTSGSTSSMTSLYYDTTYTLNSNGFVKTGYTFTGWNTKANGTGTSYTDKQSFKNLTTTNGGTVTLYAQWEADEANIYVYYIDYYTNKTLDSYSYTGIYGEDVTTTSKDLDGYTLIKSPDTESYTLGTTDTYVYYYYAKNSDVIVYYLNYYTDEEIEDTVTIEGYEGLSYATEEKQIESYEFVTSTSNTSGTMEDETIYVYYYYEELVSLEITKINYDNEPLEGAVFSLFELICTNSSHDHSEELIDIDDYNTDCWELVGTFTSDEEGIICLEDLYISGTYRLIETTAPGGYVLPTGQLEIQFNYDDNLDEESIHTIGDLELLISGIGNCPYIDIEKDVLYLYNKEAITLPLTGGMGTAYFTCFSLTFITFGIIGIYINKRKK